MVCCRVKMSLSNDVVFNIDTCVDYSILLYTTVFPGAKTEFKFVWMSETYISLIMLCDDSRPHFSIYTYYEFNKKESSNTQAKQLIPFKI